MNVTQQLVYVPKAVQPVSSLQGCLKESDHGVFFKGSGSGNNDSLQQVSQTPSEGKSSVPEDDSSDILSSESEFTNSSEDIASLEEDYSGFEEVLSKRQRKGLRGKGLKST